MYRILIAEDEEIIRNGLKSILEWETLDCRIVADVSDGAQAIEQIDRLRPDLVVSDIRMPVVDGLSVARHIREQGYDTRIIFLTGYNEFSYASEAIKNGVFDYLLKPVSVDALRSAVTRALQSLREERQLKADCSTFRTIVENNMSGLRGNFIRQSVLYGVESGPALLAKLDFFGIRYPIYQLILVEIDNYNELRALDSEYDRQLTKFLIKKKIDETLEHFYEGFILDYQPSSFILLVGYQKEDDLSPILEEAGEIIARSQSISLTFAVSRFFTNYAEAGEVFRDTESLLNAKFYLGGGIVINEKVYSAYSGGGRKEYRPLVQRIFQSIREYNWQKSRALVKELTEKAQDESDYRNIGDIRNLFVEIFALLSSELEKLNLNLAEILSAQPYETILRAESLQEIARFYEEAAELVDNAMEEKRTSQHNSVVNTICDYINNHYDKEITLDDVALLVHMNASYVSRVIKKVTGQNFIEILLSTRIEHAKQLLRNPAVKTYQVAEQVGISDSKYFSQLFKKATGMTPTEYRNFNYKG